MPRPVTLDGARDEAGARIGRGRGAAGKGRPRHPLGEAILASLSLPIDALRRSVSPRVSRSVADSPFPRPRTLGGDMFHPAARPGPCPATRRLGVDMFRTPPRVRGAFPGSAL